MTVTILDQMQMLDQQITPSRPLAEQQAHVLERSRIDLAALGGAPRPSPANRRLANCATI
jgi:hypothetical protein